MFLLVVCQCWCVAHTSVVFCVFFFVLCAEEFRSSKHKNSIFLSFWLSGRNSESLYFYVFFRWLWRFFTVLGLVFCESAGRFFPNRFFLKKLEKVLFLLIYTSFRVVSFDYVWKQMKAKNPLKITQISWFSEFLRIFPIFYTGFSENYRNNGRFFFKEYFLNTAKWWFLNFQNIMSRISPVFDQVFFKQL